MAKEAPSPHEVRLTLLDTEVHSPTKFQVTQASAIHLAFTFRT